MALATRGGHEAGISPIGYDAQADNYPVLRSPAVVFLISSVDTASHAE